MLLGREAMSGRVLVDPAQQPFGQPTNDNLKELYKTQSKTGLRIGVLASNPECTATNGLWKRVRCVVTKCIS
jgi:ribosomal protein S6--L-glutamate ligase